MLGDATLKYVFGSPTLIWFILPNAFIHVVDEDLGTWQKAICLVGSVDNIIPISHCFVAVKS